MALKVLGISASPRREGVRPYSINPCSIRHETGGAFSWPSEAREAGSSSIAFGSPSSPASSIWKWTTWAVCASIR